jgi:uncharacterized membrane protein SirB2
LRAHTVQEHKNIQTTKHRTYIHFLCPCIFNHLLINILEFYRLGFMRRHSFSLCLPLSLSLTHSLFLVLIYILCSCLFLQQHIHNSRQLLRFYFIFIFFYTNIIFHNFNQVNLIIIMEHEKRC